MKNFLLIAVAVILTCLSCKKTESRIRNTNSGKVIFNEYVNDSTSRVVLINEDGTDRTVITSLGNAYVTSEPFDNKIAILKVNGDYATKIYIYDIANDSALLVIEDNSAAYISASLSKTLDKIVFIDDVYAGVINSNGTNKQNFTDDYIGEAMPTFSLDGTKFFYIHSGDSYTSCETYMHTTKSRLTNGLNKIVIDSSAATGDGAKNIDEHSGRIAYVKQTHACDGSILSSSLWTANTNGSNKTNVLTITNGDGLGEPEWSPDGTKIAFGMGVDIFTINADGSGIQNLTNSTNREYYYPQWTADGQKLVVSNYDNNFIYYSIINVSTLQKTDLTNQAYDLERAFTVK